MFSFQEEIKKLKVELSSKHKEKSTEGQVNGNGIENDETTLTPEASIKLQGRFTDVMKKLADASDEKQKLEHLVMQLQGETETIGETGQLFQ
jgi:Putative golgin subfamily A member 2-like protein 5